MIVRVDNGSGQVINIAEKVTGKDLADLIQQRIAGPLHLRDTYLITGADHPDNPTRAHGYEPDADRLAPLLPPGTPAGTAFAGPRRPNGYVDTTNVNMSTEWAAGAMVSTARDWARFHTALMSGHLLPAAELQQMRTTVPEGPDTPNRRYGLGVEQVVTPCGTVLGTRRPGPRILQRGLHRQHRPAHGVGIRRHHLRHRRPP